MNGRKKRLLYVDVKWDSVDSPVTTYQHRNSLRLYSTTVHTCNVQVQHPFTRTTIKHATATYDSPRSIPPRLSLNRHETVTDEQLGERTVARVRYKSLKHASLGRSFLGRSWALYTLPTRRSRVTVSRRTGRDGAIRMRPPAVG